MMMMMIFRMQIVKLIGPGFIFLCHQTAEERQEKNDYVSAKCVCHRGKGIGYELSKSAFGSNRLSNATANPSVSDARKPCANSEFFHESMPLSSLL